MGFSILMTSRKSFLKWPKTASCIATVNKHSHHTVLLIFVPTFIEIVMMQVQAQNVVFLSWRWVRVRVQVLLQLSFNAYYSAIGC